MQKKTGSLFELFVAAAHKNEHKLFYTYKYYGCWIQVTYGNALSKVISALLSLNHYSIKKGDHIALLSENKPEWILAYLTINALGGTVVPIDSLLSKEEIFNIMTHSDAKLLLTSEQFYSQMQQTITQKDIPLINIDALFNLPSQHRIADLPTDLPKFRADDVMSIIYTSGTTGHPKGVMLTINNFFSVSIAIHQMIPLTKTDNLLALLPFHHVYSFAGNIYVVIKSEAALVFPESLKSDDILEAIKEGKITIIALVPQILELFYRGIISSLQKKSYGIQLIFKVALAGSLFCEKYHLINPFKLFFREIRQKFGHSFRFFASGGSKLNPFTFEQFRAFGLPLLEGYGLTETASAVLATNFEQRFPLGSIGYPLKGMEIKIHNPNADGIGEILIKGPCVMKGYYKNKELTHTVLKDDWFYTGDLGVQDRKGRFAICGRLKDMIVLPSGKNVYPDEVAEHYQTRTELIEELCVFGIKDSLGNEKVAALIYPKQILLSHSFPELNELFSQEFSHITKNLPSYKTISEWKFSLDPLPKTNTRKFKVDEIRSLYLSISASSKDGIQSGSVFELRFESSEIGKRLKTVLKSILVDVQESDMTFSANLAIQLGLDSLCRIDMICALEKEFNLFVSDEDAFAFNTVGDIYNYIENNKANTVSFISGINPEQTSSLERKYFLALRDVLTKPQKVNFMHGFLMRIYTLFSRIRYQGLSNIPYKGPYILYTNTNHPLAYFWILSAFSEQSRLNIYAIDYESNSKLFSPVSRKVGNVIKLKSISSMLSVSQIGEHVLKNRHVLFLQSNETNPHKQPLILKEAVNLASQLKCPILPIIINDSEPLSKNIGIKDQIVISFKPPIATGHVLLDPDFRILKNSQTVEKKLEEMVFSQIVG